MQSKRQLRRMCIAIIFLSFDALIALPAQTVVEAATEYQSDTEKIMVSIEGQTVFDTGVLLWAARVDPKEGEGGIVGSIKDLSFAAAVEAANHASGAYAGSGKIALGPVLRKPGSSITTSQSGSLPPRLWGKPDSSSSGTLLLGAGSGSWSIAAQGHSQENAEGCIESIDTIVLANHFGNEGWFLESAGFIATWPGETYYGGWGSGAAPLPPGLWQGIAVAGALLSNHGRLGLWTCGGFSAWEAPALAGAFELRLIDIPFFTRALQAREGGDPLAIWDASLLVHGIFSGTFREFSGSPPEDDFLARIASSVAVGSLKISAGFSATSSDIPDPDRAISRIVSRWAPDLFAWGVDLGWRSWKSGLQYSCSDDGSRQMALDFSGKPGSGNGFLVPFELLLDFASSGSDYVIMPLQFHEAAFEIHPLLKPQGWQLSMQGALKAQVRAAGDVPEVNLSGALSIVCEPITGIALSMCLATSGEGFSLLDSRQSAWELGISIAFSK